MQKVARRGVQGKRLDLAGARYGRLLVLRRLPPKRTGVAGEWLVRCDCGTQKSVSTSALRTGDTLSCGCLHREQSAKRLSLIARNNVRHGHARWNGATATYRTWTGMLARCRNPEDPGWRDYGGRGIRVCARWLRFENFLADMGRRPRGRTLDRCDVNGNYTPRNCCWATAKQQNRNTRRNRLLTFRGKTLSLAEWVERLGLSEALVRQRIRKGWSAAAALTAPRYSKNSRHRLITYRGRTMHLSAWATELGVCAGTLSYRISAWPLKRALAPQELRHP